MAPSPYVRRCAELVAELTRAYAHDSKPWPLPERFCVEVLDAVAGLCLMTHSRRPLNWIGQVVSPGATQLRSYTQHGFALCCASQEQARREAVEDFNARQLKHGVTP